MGKADLAIRGGWFPRLLRALRLVEVRDDGTTTHIAGSDFIGDTASPRQYAAINSMSAMSAFPWVRSCVEAISSDLTKVPLRVIRGRGADAEPIDDHPVLDLLERPSSTMPGVLLRRQLIVDMVLTGDAFLLVAGADEPRALIRLHPERVRVIPSDDGQIQGYEFSGAGSTQRYTFEQVLHIRLPSWQETPAMLYGTGAIEALQHDLTTDLAAAKLAAASASNGMPTGIISPSEEGDRWSSQQIKQLREGFEKQLKSKSGVILMGAGVDYKQLSLKLRDMEYQNTRIMAREAVLAAMGVPPVVVGLPNANFATAQAQRRQFAETQQGRAALIDSELTRLARMFPDSDGVRVVHDFSEVDALQESRTERVSRVQSWWLMGVPLSEAAAMEGFDQLDAADIQAEAPTDQAPTDQAAGLAKWLVYDGAGDAVTTDLDTEDGRAAVWRGFIEKVHGPAERKMAINMRRYLRAQAARISKRLKEHMPEGKAITRSIDDITLDKILDEVFEREQILNIFRPQYRALMREAFDATANSIDQDLMISPEAIQQRAETAARLMSDQILATTGEQVRVLVNELIDEGAPIGEMQGRIMQASGFNAARALTIARTESTRVANTAANMAFQEAADTGLVIQKQWLSARDGNVRDSHTKLDGQKVNQAGQFSFNGATADAPGLFGVGALDINCRCTIIGKVVNK